MKVIDSAFFLVFGSSFLTFAAVAFLVSRHAPTLSNPGLLVEAIGVAGAVFMCLGGRGLLRIQRALAGVQKASTDVPVG